MENLRQNAYLVLAVAGLLLAWYHGLQWTMAWLDEGGNLLNQAAFFGDFFGDAYTANHAASFITVDLVGSWFAFLVFVLPEAKRLGMRFGWGYIVAACTLGNCFAFPLFLFNRERALAART
ncbi:MAG: DUF2834 domain-containing protein [Planctomycetes bacterium]|nr:DUF2834 domain-containing protein [Planctomycetota bacterium]